MRKSLLPLAALAALSLPIAPTLAQPSTKGGEAKSLTGVEGSLAFAQGRLAWALIEKLSARGGGTDATVSPASLAAAFGIVALGADAGMRAAIVKTLGFGSAPVDASLNELSEVQSKLSNAGGVFQSANRIVFAPSNPPGKLLRAGLESLKIDYSIDDLSKPEAAAKIDAWVNETTKGAIPEILGGPIERSAFVALNALHFKDRWMTPFDAKATAQEPFRSIDGKADDVAMMRLDLGTYFFRKESNFVGIDLPFSDRRFSLVIVTTTDKPAPPKGFAKVADWLGGTGFAAKAGYLRLPRFSLSRREDLLATLDALGLDKARHSKTALQGLAPGAMLSQVIQRTMIDVDEEGAEAAAATAVMGSRSITPPTDEIDMVVDKPFIFALRDSETGLILVAGYVGHTPRGKVV